MAVFNAGRVGAKKTRPLLNVTLAQILAFAQLTQLCAAFHWGKTTPVVVEADHRIPTFG